MTDTFDILDQTVEDLADLPEFKPWPAGTYLIELTTDIEEVEQTLENGNKVKREVPKLVFGFKEVVELDNPDEEAPGEKAKFFLSTYLVKKDGTRNEFGEGQLKMVLMALKDMYPDATTNRELIKAASGTLLAVTTKIRKRKDQEGNQREENQIVAVLNPEALDD